MGGAVAVAHTTQTSEWRRPFLTRDVAKQWFGYDVPDHVLQIKVLYQVELDARVVYWQKNDGTIHSMPFEVDQETVEAVLIAMKLS